MPKITWQQILFYGSLAVVEASPAALIATMAGSNVWLALVALAALAGAASHYSEPWLPERVHQAALLAVGTLLAAGVFALAAQASQRAEFISGGAYLALLGALYTFWRGTRMGDQDSLTITRTFRTSMGVLVAVLAGGSLLLSPDQAMVASGAAQLVGFFAAGMLCIALAHHAEQEGGLQQIEWRGVGILVASIVLIMAAAMLLASFTGGFAKAMLEGLITLLATAIGFILLPFGLLLEAIIGWLQGIFAQGSEMGSLSNQFEALQQIQNAYGQGSGGAFPWANLLVQAFCLIIPILALIAIFFLRKNTTARQRTTNEQRESILRWGEVAEDLAGLFGRKRKQADLRQALAAITGGSAASRIRRSYIRMLLAAEARERQRQASQTPREFAPAAAQALGQPAERVAALTAAYERARYAPETATPEQAASAEAAWEQISASQKK